MMQKQRLYKLFMVDLTLRTTTAVSTRSCQFHYGAISSLNVLTLPREIYGVWYVRLAGVFILVRCFITGFAGTRMCSAL